MLRSVALFGIIARMSQALVDATNDALSDPDIVRDICRHIAGTGSLRSFCAQRRLEYGMVREFLAEGEAARAYADALVVRDDNARDLVVDELTAIIDSDLTQAFDADGNLLRMAEMPERIRRMVAGVKFREIFEMQGKGEDRAKVHVGNVIELKFIDKMKAIELRGRTLAMFTDKTQHDVGVTLEDLIRESMNEDAPAVRNDARS